MADFLKAFDYMITNEDYPYTDPRFGRTTIDNNGGKVRFGVNSVYHPELLQTDFYTLPVTQAIKIAQNLYNNNEWKKISGDNIKSQKVASKMLDMAVNMGWMEACKLAQRAAFGLDITLNKVDGLIGPVTLRWINALDENLMLKKLSTWWLWFIQQEIKNKPRDIVYINDWNNRANKVPELLGA